MKSVRMKKLMGRITGKVLAANWPDFSISCTVDPLWEKKETFLSFNYLSVTFV